MTDGEFLEAFDDGTLPRDDFTHGAHVRLAWICLRRLGFEEGSRRVVAGIRAFAALHGATGLYHETVTRAWLALIAAADTAEAASFDAFLAAHPGLFVRGVLERHYDPRTLASEEARARFMAPDREPLPAPLSRPGQHGAVEAEARGGFEGHGLAHELSVRGVTRHRDRP